MNLAKMYAMIVLGFVLLLSRTDGEKLCSCYSFNNQTNGNKWPQAMGSCEHNSKTLVVMETGREWEFIKNAIQDRVGSKYGEWFIGLEKNFTTEKWTWINGKPLTIAKWQSSNPEPNDLYGLIHKEYPDGFKGSFSSIKGIIQRGWICEEETDNCRGDCFFHAVPTSTSPPGTKAASTRRKTSTEQDITSPPETKAVTTRGKTSTKQDITNPLGKKALTTRGKTSTEQYITGESGSSKNIFTPTTPKSTDEVLTDYSSSPSPTVMIAAASLCVVLFVVLIILIAVILLRRKQRQGEDAESAKPKKSRPKNDEDQFGESQYESVNPVEAAKLLGSPNSTSDESNTRFDPPPESCEYAVVNKANKKRKEGDLVYAQLANFDNKTDASKPPKPPSYEPTIYADVEELPPELPGREDLDSSQPTYANLEMSGV